MCVLWPITYYGAYVQKQDGIGRPSASVLVFVCRGARKKEQERERARARAFLQVCNVRVRGARVLRVNQCAYVGVRVRFFCVLSTVDLHECARGRGGENER